MAGMDNRHHRRGANLIEFMWVLLPFLGAIIGAVNGANINGRVGGLIGFLAGVGAGYLVFMTSILLIAAFGSWILRNEKEPPK
jgi:uncharacterized membrane protein